MYPMEEARGIAGTTGFAVQMPPQKFASPVEEGIERVEKACVGLEQEIGRLESRLGSVLSPATDLPGEKLAAIQQERGPLADGLHRKADTLDALSFRLTQLTNRIEL